LSRGKSTQSTSRIYLVVLSSLMLLVAALGGGIIWFNSVKTEQLALVLADRLMLEIGDEILERVQRLYDPMVAIVALAARVPELQAMCEAEDPPALPFFIRGLKGYPQILSLYVGFANGEFFMVSHVAGEQRAALGAPNGTEFANERILVGADAARRVSWRFLDGEGRLIASRDDPASTFDPRQRDWYKMARSDLGDVQRTQPYQFASSKEMGVTLSRSVEGRMDGAFGADLAIGELSRFLAKQTISKTSRVFIFDGEGTVIADPAQIARSGGDQPIVPGTRIADLGDPVMAGLYHHFSQARGSTSLAMAIAGRDYEARIRALPERYGKDEYLAIVVPTEEILEPITAIRTDTLLYSLAFLLFALPLYATLVVAWIDRRVARHVTETGAWRPEEES
jgi:adenylate cyclase